MIPDLQKLRNNYESFDDSKLFRLATEDANELRPEALQLLKEIIKERGLSENILKGIDAQFQEVDEKMLSDYSDLLRKLPCPLCHSQEDSLNATMKGTAVSVILFTHYEKSLIIACPDCLDKQNKNAMIKSALLGWWGFP